MIDSSRADFQAGSDSDLPSSSLPNQRHDPREHESHLLARAKKAFAYCRRYTKEYWYKTRSDSSESFGLETMSSSSSNESRREKLSTLSTGFCIGRPSKSNSHRHQLSPSYSYTGSSEIDPFITSPSWLKAEFSEHERRF
ncbi:hypothetical protein IQ07DRAFT_68546 [Pyrenochaeta sp. DS3sAY3a]|nr:hypothetical protein IQ07DRAFT_68546 [Pyrenochaeta sp. DS3sAY3a]